MVAFVALQNELDQPIAETTNAVVKNYWIGFGFRQLERMVTLPLQNDLAKSAYEPGDLFETASLKFERLDVCNIGLVPTADGRLRSGQLNKVRALWRFDNGGAHPVV